MSTSLILPCAQPPKYVSPNSLKTAAVERSPALLNFGSFNPYGSCQNPNRDSNILSTKLHGGPIHLSNVNSSRQNPTTPAPVHRTFHPTSPSEVSNTLSSRSPTSPVSIPSPTSIKFFNSGHRLKKSQSTLIMPNFITFLRQGQNSSTTSSQNGTSIFRPARRKEHEFGLTRGSSTKSLSFYGEESAAFGADPASPQPLLRKCQTVIALSGNSKGTTTTLSHDKVRDKKAKLNLLRKIASSKSAIFLSSRTAPSVIKKSTSAIQTNTSHRTRKTSAPDWPDLEEETYLESLQETFDPSSRGCSRCASTTSLASTRYSGSGYDDLFCKLCLSEVSITRMYQLQQCECRFCTRCMHMYTTIKIKDGEANIECPDSNCDCNGELQLDEIEALVGRDLLNLHLQVKRNRDVALDPYKTWCPTPGCETEIMLSFSKLQGRPQCCLCPKCAETFCATCTTHWHPGRPCHPADINLEIPLNDSIKRCPRCKVPIERDAGCAQMQCKKCKHVFCWYCLASLEDDFLLRHYDKGPCKNKLGHSRASVLWHRAQVVIIFAGFGLLLMVASPVLLFIGPCLLCRTCKSRTKYDLDDDTSSVL